MTMYLSNVRLSRRNRDPGSVLALDDLYGLHRRISFAFGGETDQARPLWRLEEGLAGPRLLVQSRSLPDWERAFSDAPALLDGSEVKPYDPAFRAGEVLRFLLRANPTRKPSGTDRRVGLRDELGQQLWLRRHGGRSGFDVLAVRVLRRGDAVAYRPGSGRVTVFTVDFEGLLKVVDPAAFRAALERGIGPARFLGCGLISLARAPQRG
jgi:CRISPR system Cascade subunit CasE